MRTTSLSLMLVAMLACGGTDDDASATMPDDASQPGYAVASCIDAPDGSSGYVMLLNDLAAGEKPSLERALEVPGCGVITAGTEEDVFFVGEGESPLLRRYRVKGASFETEGELSLAGLGIADAFYSQPHFVHFSDTKAYILSGKGAPEVIIWNPQTMEITNTIQLEGLERGSGLYPAFSYAPQRVGNRLFVSARWRNNDGFLRENALIVIDTDSDSVVDISFDERCADFLYTVKAEDSTLYFSNGNYTSAFRLALGEATAPPACILRVLPGETRYDPTFQIDLSELVDGREAGGLVPGPDGTWFVQAYFADEVPVPAGTEWGDVFGLAGWRFVRLNANLEEAEVVAELPFTAAAFDAFSVGDAFLSTLSAADYSETTFIEMTSDTGVPRAGRTVAGWVAGVVKLR